MKAIQFFIEGTLQQHAGDTELCDLFHLISFTVPVKEMIQLFQFPVLYQYISCETCSIMFYFCIEYSRFLLGYSDCVPATKRVTAGKENV
jgi:hypothetical protein